MGYSFRTRTERPPFLFSDRKKRTRRENENGKHKFKLRITDWENNLYRLRQAVGNSEKALGYGVSGLMHPRGFRRLLHRRKIQFRENTENVGLSNMLDRIGTKEGVRGVIL